MNKTQLIDHVAQHTGKPRKVVADVLESTLETIAITLGQGESVQITGFGTFEVRTRAARMGRNPQTGAEMQIGETTRAGFKPGKLLKDHLS